MSRKLATFETQAAVVLTCLTCGRTYEPSNTDLEAGRTHCPDRGCGGWAFRVQPLEPRAPDAPTLDKECLP